MKVVIAGGGLVGALLTQILGKDGHEVHLFESRQDPRLSLCNEGRSMNLAISTRGRAALASAGMEEIVLTNSVPMKGRMLHCKNGAQKAVLYDPIHNQCIYSIDRQFLNRLLLTEAEKQPNTNIQFNHKLVNVNFETNTATLEHRHENNENNVKVQADLIIGADGAYSSLRKCILRKEQIFYSNFTQTYIKHGYIELSIPANKQGQYLIEKNYLHIWPRDDYMLLASPNLDGTFTAILFMPFQIFEQLNSEEKVEKFFKSEFPDALNLIGEELLLATFFKYKPSSLVSIKCSPHHHVKTVLVGDAAHAMVPFFGQGMNAGFEDVLILTNILKKCKDISEVEAALEFYSKKRVVDAHAICELSMHHYIEMRKSVNQQSYHWRRAVDWTLNKLIGNRWTPLYSAVTFSLSPYSICLKQRKQQDKVLELVTSYGTITLLLGFLSFILIILQNSTGGNAPN